MEEKEIVERVVKLETKSEQHDKDIVDLKDHTKFLHEMNTNIKLLAIQGTTQTEKIEGIEQKVSKLDQDMEDVKVQADKKNAQKWDKLMWLVAGAIITMIAGIVKSALGL